VQALARPGNADQWLIDGITYLLRRESLSKTQYPLITMAALDHLHAVRR
jgi:hypothetical protein